MKSNFSYVKLECIQKDIISKPKMEAMESRRRVKVYELGNGAEWEDRGTGHVTMQYFGSEVVLEVRSESDGERRKF